LADSVDIMLVLIHCIVVSISTVRVQVIQIAKYHINTVGTRWISTFK